MAEPQEIRSVTVTNISPSANEKTVSDFFSFCGKITKLFLKKEEGKDTSAAIIQFETESAAKTALLLTNALIVDRPITVSPYGAIPTTTPTPIPTTTTPMPYPSPVTMTTDPGSQIPPENITKRDYGDVPDDQRSKTSVVASLLAAGYVLANDALEKAKTIDEKHNLSTRAKATVDQIKVKVNEIDVQYGISDKATAMKNSVTETAKKLDSDYKISEKATLAANTVKATAQSGYQKAQENPTIKKGLDQVKATAQKVSTSVTSTYNDMRDQTKKEIDDKQKDKDLQSSDVDQDRDLNPPIVPTPTPSPMPVSEDNSTNQ